MTAADLVGRWVMVRSRTEQPVHAIEFTVAGDLVYSNPRKSGLERVLLTFELDGDELITDQPFAPRQERIALRLAADGRLVLGEDSAEVFYERELKSSDDDALLLAIAGRALRHAVDSAIEGAPFFPFLWWHDAVGWHVYRFINDSSNDAETLARSLAISRGAGVQACAFVFDGYSTVAEVRHDTAFCQVSRRDPSRGLVAAQPYRPGARGGSAIGGIQITHAVESWLENTNAR